MTLNWSHWCLIYTWILTAKYRQEAGLPVLEEDTIEVTKTMRAASPPASAADLLEAQNQKPGAGTRPFRRVSYYFLITIYKSNLNRMIASIPHSKA